MGAGRPGQHVVLIAGGAVAGSEVAFQLALRDVLCVVFEQHARPYGKIEDGLPRWHVKLRRQEMDKIDTKLTHSNIAFVPNTAVGRDLALEELLRWGPSALVLATGAGRDRPLPLPGIDGYVGRGFYYQNPLVYWFNHWQEPGYRGEQVALADGALVVGGGLASLDVVKILMLETVAQALAARGAAVDLLELERLGIARCLEEQGLGLDALGLRGCRLFYRRRLEDMPLVDLAPAATPAQAEQARALRRRMLKSFQTKYCFEFEDRQVPVGYLTAGDRLAGLRLARTEVGSDGVSLVPGSERAVPAPLVVSSIGSVPEPLPGLALRGHLYPVRDTSTGELEGLPGVFAVGNVLTGKGNIAVSLRHGRTVSQHMLEQYLAGAAAGYEEVLAEAESAAQHQAAALAARLTARAPLPAERVARILADVRERQRRVGYPGAYPPWIAEVRPAA